MSVIENGKRIVLAVLVCLVMFRISSNVFVTRVNAGIYGTTRITDNDSSDSYPKVDDGLIVWESSAPHLLFLYNVSSGKTMQIPNSVNGSEVQIDSGIVVWQRFDGYDYEIFLYEVSTNTTKQITANNVYDGDPQVGDGLVVWERYDGSDDEICLYEVSSNQITQITNNNYLDEYPQVDSGLVVWEGWPTGETDSEIFLYNVSSPPTITRITTNDRHDDLAQVDDGLVVWEGYDGSDYEIYLYDTSSKQIKPITTNNYDDINPQINSGIVAWEKEDPDFSNEICFCNVSTMQTTQITDNDKADYLPQVDGGLIVWSHGEVLGVGPSNEIFLYEISSNTTIQITNNNNPDVEPQVGDGIVVWNWGETIFADSEVFFTRVDSTPPYTTISFSGTLGENDWYTTNVTVTLTVTDTQSGPRNTYYRVGASSTWIEYATSFSVTTEGTNTIQYYSSDRAVPSNNESIRTATLKIDKTPPTGSITINSGATYTNATSVVLSLTATDTTSQMAQMCFSNNDTIYTTWQTYDTSRSWTLQEGDGLKTVYAQFRDNAGLTSTCSDTITLDTTPPTGSIIIAEDAEHTDSSSVTLTLSASDATSGAVEQMCFSNDNSTWTAWEAYTIYKDWTLLGGDGVKSVYVKFMDILGFVSPSYQDSIILDRLPPSMALTSSLANGTEIKSSTYEISWTASDPGMGIDHYEVRLDSGTWTDLGALTTYTFTGLGDGGHTFAIKAVDKTGKFQIYSVDVVINTSPIGGPGYLEEALIGGAVGAAVVGAVVYKIRKRPKKPPTPAQLRVTAQPASLVADGESKSTITIQLLDKKGKPIAALADTQIKITTSKGKLETPIITIPKGKDTEKTIVVSSTDSGPVALSAVAEGLRSITVTLNFVEKKRFCMHCGALMPFKAKTCPNCGKVPPAGVDTKACMNCKSIIPAVAKFCSECGAGQPE